MDTQPYHLNKPARLVGFSGPAGVGKSEASRLLTESYGFVLVKFAAPLKSMLAALYEVVGLDDEESERRLEGDLKEKPDWLLSGASPRHAMQTLGTEWGRVLIHPDLWVNAWKRSVRSKLDAGISVVVDDLRFQNEATLIRELGGEIIQIMGTPRRQVFAHPSEVFDFDPDKVIANNGRIEVLWDRVTEALSL